MPSRSTALARDRAEAGSLRHWLPSKSRGRSAGSNSARARAMSPGDGSANGRRAGGPAAPPLPGLKSRRRCRARYHSRTRPGSPASPPPASRYQSCTVCSSYRMSTGTSTNTGPGTPSKATWKPRSRVGAMSRTRRTETAHLTCGENSASWSMSWSAPRPLSRVAVAPPSTTTGDCASCAFFTAVTVLVTPGPAVTAATPAVPPRRATASAAKTAVASCRTSTTRIPRALAPTRIGEMCPPHRVKRNRTPCAARASAMTSPPFTAKFLPTRSLGSPGRRDPRLP